MSYLTPDEASERICPVARIQGTDKVKTNCAGPDCILWRWRPVMAGDPSWLAAHKREITMLKGEHPEYSGERIHKLATEKINKNPEDFGCVPTVGWCGLGGVPT